MTLKPLMLALLLSAGFTPVAAQEVPTVPAPDDLTTPPADAVVFQDGLSYRVLQPGSGKLPEKKYVRNIMMAWTQADGVLQFNGEAQGNSVDAPEQVGQMMPALKIMLRQTPVGEKRRWWIAGELLEPAFDGFVAGDYTIDMEVLEDIDPLPAPADVAAVPVDAERTETGLAMKVLTPGTSELAPTAADSVTVHYTGWTTDGEMFDSSVMRGTPSDFPVGGLIAGMTEGLQRMSVGEKARLWIPKDLAYGDNPRPGAPFGMLVFDVELIAILPPAP